MSIKTYCPIHGLILTEETQVFAKGDYFRNLGQTHFCPKCGSPTKIERGKESVSGVYWSDKKKEID